MGTRGRKLTATLCPQVTQLRVFVLVLDINDNVPEFPFVTKVETVSEVRGARASRELEATAWPQRSVPGAQGTSGPFSPPPQDTKVNTTVIPETRLKAQDPDENDILFYTLQEVTPVSGPHLCTNPRPSLRAGGPLPLCPPGVSG